MSFFRPRLSSWCAITLHKNTFFQWRYHLKQVYFNLSLINIISKFSRKCSFWILFFFYFHYNPSQYSYINIKLEYNIKINKVKAHILHVKKLTMSRLLWERNVPMRLLGRLFGLGWSLSVHNLTVGSVIWSWTPLSSWCLGLGRTKYCLLTTRTAMSHKGSATCILWNLNWNQTSKRPRH